MLGEGSGVAKERVEIEAQPIGGDQRARLMDLVAQDFAQRVMEDMGRRMVQHRGVAPDAIDLERHTPAALEVAHIAAQHAPEMHDRAVGLPRVRDLG